MFCIPSSGMPIPRDPEVLDDEGLGKRTIRSVVKREARCTAFNRQLAVVYGISVYRSTFFFRVLASV